jgi:hypothetical protein
MSKRGGALKALNPEPKKDAFWMRNILQRSDNSNVFYKNRVENCPQVIILKGVIVHLHIWHRKRVGQLDKLI